MSVLFKSPSNNSVSIGGSNKGFPPGDISNIQHVTKYKTVMIKWTDPEDTIVDEAVFVKWKGTLLVRNNNHYPTSIKDGDIVVDNTERNKYKDVWYEDTNLINDTTYYYRFFSYSEDKVYNDSGNLVFKDKPLSLAPILKNNTWEQIIAASENNNIPDTWNIGDEIDLVLSGSFNETVTLQIWDFNHFDKSDGTGKAGICFGMKNLMKNKQQANTNSNVDDEWNNSVMRNTVMKNVLNSIPIELRNNIKEVNTEASSANGRYPHACTDKIFIPGYTEVGWAHADGADGNQFKFPIFSDNASRIKKLNNGTGSDDNWWSRSIRYEWQNLLWWSVGPDGWLVYDNAIGAYEKHGVCFCFNI